ncbi:MAG TPA: Uma2 family endonuclease [Thermoanaerobaculia bacterium]|nr:Uma2 family endonuclease [Thermoanaerobaculia bacterium]
MAAIPLQREEIEYPTSDGQPMAETTLHRRIMTDLIQGLERQFRDAPDVWVGGNLFFYFEQGRPQAVVAPDVLLVKGVPKWDRPIYKLWEEGRVPSLVVEVTSESTRDEDLSKKKGIYQRLGVEEYFLFDPYGDYLEPRLQGRRLESGRYVPMASQPDGSLASSTTGLILRPEGERLRLVDPVAGPLLWMEELEDELARLRAERKPGAADNPEPG